MRLRFATPSAAAAVARRLAMPTRFAREGGVLVAPFDAYDPADPDVRAFLVALRGGVVSYVLASVAALPARERAAFWTRLLADTEWDELGGVRCGDGACVVAAAVWGKEAAPRDGRTAPVPIATLGGASLPEWLRPTPLYAV